MLTPQGHGNHETNCDENPNPGVPYDFQIEQGLLEIDMGGPADRNPDPDQSVENRSDGTLPPRETTARVKEVPSTQTSTDGGTDECPICGHEDTMDAENALSEYISVVEHPHPKAVLAYRLADKCCNNPTCAALWGDEYHEPIPMGEVLQA